MNFGEKECAPGSTDGRFSAGQPLDCPSPMSRLSGSSGPIALVLRVIRYASTSWTDALTCWLTRQSWIADARTRPSVPGANALSVLPCAPTPTLLRQQIRARCESRRTPRRDDKKSSLCKGGYGHALIILLHLWFFWPSLQGWPQTPDYAAEVAILNRYKLYRVS